jgi:hypothetical protein
LVRLLYNRDFTYLQVAGAMRGGNRTDGILPDCLLDNLALTGGRHT